jgi:hypothetical protein
MELAGQEKRRGLMQSPGGRHRWFRSDVDADDLTLIEQLALV